MSTLTPEEIEKAYPEAYRLARKFHDLYEENAPLFGYETKRETRVFDPKSKNGRLMAFVCYQIVSQETKDIRDNLIRDIKDGVFYPLQRCKEAWDMVEHTGNPNEILKAQIFGFMQAFSMINRDFFSFLNPEE